MFEGMWAPLPPERERDLENQRREQLERFQRLLMAGREKQAPWNPATPNQYSEGRKRQSDEPLIPAWSARHLQRWFEMESPK